MSNTSPSALAPTAVTALALALASVPACRGQAAPASFGAGGLVGTLSGLTVKYYAQEHRAYDAFLTRDRTWAVALNGHLLREGPVPASPLSYFVGLGLFAGLQRDASDHPAAGGSANAGLNFFSARFEVFLQATPHVWLTPEFGSRLGASAGLRYYF